MKREILLISVIALFGLVCAGGKSQPPPPKPSPTPVLAPTPKSTPSPVPSGLGSFVSAVSFAVHGTDHGYSVATAVGIGPDDEIWPAGELRSGSIQMNSTLSMRGTWVGKISSYGIPQFISNNVHDSHWELPGITALDIDSTGNSYAYGYFDGTISAQGTLSTGSILSSFLIKRAPNGTVLFAKMFSAGNTFISRDLKVKNGQLILCGFYRGSGGNIGGLSLNTTTYTDGVVAVLDLNGNGLKYAVLGGSGSHFARIDSVDVDSNGNVFVSAYCSGSGCTAGSFTVPGGVVVAGKLNSNLVWQNVLVPTHSSGSTSEGASVAVDSSNKVYFTGRCYNGNMGFTGLSALSCTYFDGFYLVTDSNLVPLCSTQLNGNDILPKVLTKSKLDGKIWTLGRVLGSVNFGSGVIYSSQYQYYIAQIGNNCLFNDSVVGSGTGSFVPYDLKSLSNGDLVMAGGVSEYVNFPGAGHLHGDGAAMAIAIYSP